MEAQRKLVHVHEGLMGKLAHCMLADRGKQGVAQLVQAHLQDAGEIVGDDQNHGAEQEGRKKARHIQLAVQRIGRPFEEIGNREKHQLGEDEEERGPEHPRLEVRTPRGPHIGPQVDECSEWIAVIRGNDLLLVRHAGLRDARKRRHSAHRRQRRRMQCQAGCFRWK
ncbi:hypothetical protein D3C73_512040 [compost metagenome]